MSELADGLAVVLADTFGPVEISDLRRITAGANRETWSFDASTPDTEHSFIVQMERPVDDGLLGACAREVSILGSAAGHGAPVPEVVAAGELPNALDRNFMITRRLEGETIPRRLLRDDTWATARERFIDDCAAALARIHAIPTDAPGLDQLPRIDDPLEPLTEMYLPLEDPQPAFDLALRWLDRHRPDRRPPSLVHGDFRLGNLLLDTDGLAAVLDWELAAIGDPNADLGWLCVRAWRFGAPARVAGIGTDARLLEAYNTRAGTQVDIATLRWWELYGTVRWGIMCLHMGGGFRTGQTDSLELAMVGRRVVENAADVVDLLRELEASR